MSIRGIDAHLTINKAYENADQQSRVQKLNTELQQNTMQVSQEKNEQKQHMTVATEKSEGQTINPDKEKEKEQKKKKQRDEEEPAAELVLSGSQEDEKPFGADITKLPIDSRDPKKRKKINFDITV